LHEVTMQRSGSWLAAILISLVATMQVEAREGAGDPPKGLAPPGRGWTVPPPGGGQGWGADLGYQGRHRHRALAEPRPARLDPRLYSV